MVTTLLQSHQLKATKQRVELLTLLRKQRLPRTAEWLQARLQNVSVATVYRMMDDFLHVGLVHRVDLGHGHAHYEYNDPKRHHHHLVCQECGDVRDVVVPDEERLVQRLAKRHRFSLRSHSFELFGVCRSCQVTSPA